MLSVYHCGDISLRGGGKKLVVFVIPIQLPGPAEVVVSYIFCDTCAV